MWTDMALLWSGDHKIHIFCGLLRIYELYDERWESSVNYQDQSEDNFYSHLKENIDQIIFFKWLDQKKHKTTQPKILLLTGDSLIFRSIDRFHAWKQIYKTIFTAILQKGEPSRADGDLGARSPYPMQC